ncbi:DNRLRE domain-containing protein [Microtetraspora malaysiensis]|uniref:DNRLRE domain-containing protein n=1 Tax=Microtetraspora malaysiensis TaxID=161358 RepID=UPI003D8BE295
MAAVAILPGLVQLPEFPATANSGVVTLSLPGSTAGSADTLPVQQSGTAEGLAHLVDSSATQAEPSASSGGKPERPKGSLPVEQRHKTSDEPAKGGLESPPPLPEELAPPKEPDEDGTSDGTGAGPSDRQAALETAKRTGSRVLVDSETNESSLTYANADGTFSTEISSGVARVKRDGEWVAVDTSLVQADGVLKPKAAKADVVFSAGGSDEPLVTFAKGKGQSLALTWPTALPKPVVKDNTATYVDAAGKGADLVVTMLPDGFSQDVVLRERPESPVEIKLGVESDGVTLDAASAGGFEVKSEQGKVIASAPEPVMYDATATSDTASPSPSMSPSEPTQNRRSNGGVGEIDTRLVTENGRQTLVLRPDGEFLADPATRYPVRVDPTVTLTPSLDTYVETTYYSDGTYSLGSGFPSSSTLYVGTSVNTYDNPRTYVRDRAFLSFDVSSVPTNVTLTRADLQLWNSSFTSTSACETSAVTASRVNSYWWSGIAWHNQPSVDWSTSGVNVSSGTCSTSNPKAMTWDITSMAQGWVAGTSTNYGVRLSGSEGTSTLTRAFSSAEASKKPNLTLTYSLPNVAPTVGTPMVSPTVTAETGGVVTSLTPVLSTVLSDADGGSLSGEFQVQVGSTVVWSATASGIASGGKATVAVPAGKLSDGQTIKYRARAYDGIDYSSWSAWQTAQVTSMELTAVSFQQFSPYDNSQAGSLTPALSAYAQVPGEAATSYWYQLCAGPKDNWTWCESSTWVKGAWMVPAGKLQWGKTYWWYAQAATSAATATSSWRSFTTVPEQASINAQLASGTDGRDFNHVTGNYTRTEIDLVVASAGPPLSVTRTYNSLDPRSDGAFGAGWTTRWDTRLENEPLTSTVLITYPDGRQWRFAAKGDGTYASPAGTYATLATQSGGGWRLMDKASTSYWFDSAGRLLKVTDNRGRTQTLQYGTDGKLAKVTGTGGRSLTFTWSGSHVTSVASDPVDGAPITWTYAYDGDHLIKVCPPSSGSACTRYEYNDDSQYRSRVQDTKPVGYWRLNETGTGLGSLISNFFGDVSGVGNGKIAGGTADATGGTESPLAGSGDTAMTFKGTANSAYVSLPASVVSGLGGDVTIETWFKTTKSGTIFGYQNSATNAPSLYTPAIYVGTDGKLRGQFWTGTAAPITSTGTVNDDAWHHVVLSGAKTTQTLYLDGQAIGSIAKQITNLGQWDARIGYGFGSSSWPGTVSSSAPFPFAGAIDEVAVYGKPLRPEEIATRYRTRLTRHQLTKVTRPSRRVAVVNTYAADGGRLLTSTDANGGLWKLSAPAYTKDATATSIATITVTDPRNGTLTYVSDTSRDDRPVSWTDQLGKATSYAYDTGGFPAKVTDRNGNTDEFAYDGRGNLLAKSVCRAAADCATEYYAYHVDGDNMFDPRNDQVIEYRDARSSSATDDTYLTTIGYDQFGAKTKQTSPATSDFTSGRSAEWTYTDGTEAAEGGGTVPAGLLKTQTDRNGNRTTFAYTVAGDVAKMTQPTGAVTSIAYDAVGRISAKTNVSSATPDGVTTTYGYDPAGRLARLTEPGVKNDLTSVTHTREKRTTYDADGNTLTEVSADLTGGDPARTTTYTYDDQGRLAYITGPEGGVQKYTYDDKGRKTGYTDERGTTYKYMYTVRDELATTTLVGWTGSPVAPQPAADAVIASYAYDPDGRLASETDAMGRTTAFTYYGDDRRAQAIAKDAKLNGSTASKNVVLEDNTYDAAGNLTKQITGGGLTRVDRAYDAAGRLTAETLDPTKLGRTTSYTYDANDNPTKISETAGGDDRTEISEYTYNELDKPVREKVRNDGEDLVTTFTIDDRGLVTGITDPRGNASGATAADYTTTIRYDLAGRPVESLAPPVKVERDGAAPTTTRPTSRVGYNTHGELTHIQDAEGRRTTTTHDRAGRVISQAKAAYTPPGGTAVTPTVTYGYDAAGQQVRVTDERGIVTTAAYDGLGRRIQVTEPKIGSADSGRWTYTYDLAGELLSQTDPTGARIEATYDDLGRKITQTTIERRPTTAAYVTRLEYDNAGRPTKRTRPAGDVTIRAYDASGALVTETDPLGNMSRYGYDLAGRIAKVTTPLGTSTATEYDLAGRRTTLKEYDSDGGLLRTQSMAYDLAGNVISQTTPEGHAVRQKFDAANNLIELKEPVSADEIITTSFGYDAAGSRTRLSDGRGNSTIKTYNSLGLVESIIEPSTAAHPGLTDRTWTTLYDGAENPIASIAPGGVRIDQVFDELNRLTKQTGSGAEVTTAAKAFEYDLAGRLTKANDLGFSYNDRGTLLKTTGPGGDISAYAYDANGRLTQRIDAAGTAALTWDGDDRLTETTDPVTGAAISYGYDSASRLTSMGYGASGARRTFTYDPLNRRTSDELKTAAGSEIASLRYGYDLDGNMTSKTTAGTAGAGANAYAYDWSGRLTSWTAPDGQKTDYAWDAAGNRVGAGDRTYTYDERNRLLSGDGSTYTYTARGTLAEKTTGGNATTMKFDAFGRLTQDGSVQFGYDALDRMTSRTQGAAQERFSYDGLTNDLVAVTDQVGVKKASFGRDALGRLLSLNAGGGAELAFSDLHGDLVGTLTAESTELARSAAYSPFGEVIARTGVADYLGYQGGYTDTESGRVNMAARWYEPRTGAFASRDTWNLEPVPSIQANRYVYAGGSPLNRVDPTGHWWEVPTDPGQPVQEIVVSPGDSYMSGYICSGGTCHETDSHAQWWTAYMASPEFQQQQPQLVDREAKRIGYMPNGRPAPKGYWEEESDQLREQYMNEVYNVYMNDDDLELVWEVMRAVKKAWKDAEDKGSKGVKGGFTAPKKNKDVPTLGKVLKYVQNGKMCMARGAKQCAMIANIVFQSYQRSGTNPFVPDSKTHGDGRKRHFLLSSALVVLFDKKWSWEFLAVHEWGEEGTPDSIQDWKANEAGANWVLSYSRDYQLRSMYFSDQSKFWKNLEAGYAIWKRQGYPAWPVHECPQSPYQGILGGKSGCKEGVLPYT